MNILLKSVVIVDSNSKHHLKKRDVLIMRGRIEEIKSSIPNTKNINEFDGKSHYLSAGWFDMSADFCDPGLEHREDLNSGLSAAQNGGFTGVLIMPNTVPAISTKANVEYVLRKAQGHIVDTQVAASLSFNGDGKQIAEFGDLYEAGAKAFTDYKQPVNRPELMIRALEYAKNFNRTVISFPFDDQVAPQGLIHESEHSVSLGLKGIPDISEEIRLQRDIDFLRYSEGKMHVNLISTARSVDLIRKAKKEGLQITCGIAAHQLSFTAEDLAEFDTRLKVLPPFRSKTDRKALIKGLKDGTIDVICSDHSPVDIDHKKREFDYAEFGISSIETAFMSVHRALGSSFAIEDLIQKISQNPRRILGLDEVKIEEGEHANLTLFSIGEMQEFNKGQMKSKSKNTPFDEEQFPAQVIGIINNNQSTL